MGRQSQLIPRLGVLDCVRYRTLLVRERGIGTTPVFFQETHKGPRYAFVLSRIRKVHRLGTIVVVVTPLRANGEKDHVFLVGATNHPENVDRSFLGGHRSSDKWQIGVPGPEGCQKLLRKYLADVQLEAGTAVEQLAQGISGSAPADIEAICAAAKRFAFGRMGEAPELPPLSSKDFEEAVKRVRGQY